MKTTILTIAISFILGLVSFNASAQTTYRGYNDSYGNTPSRTNNGVTYRSYTDSYGNTTTTGSNGYRSTSYTDSYGNTTIRTW